MRRRATVMCVQTSGFYCCIILTTLIYWQQHPGSNWMAKPLLRNRKAISTTEKLAIHKKCFLKRCKKKTGTFHGISEPPQKMQIKISLCILFSDPTDTEESVMSHCMPQQTNVSGYDLRLGEWCFRVWMCASKMDFTEEKKNGSSCLTMSVLYSTFAQRCAHHLLPCHTHWAGTGSRVLCGTPGSLAWTTAGWTLVWSNNDTHVHFCIRPFHDENGTLGPNTFTDWYVPWYDRWTPTLYHINWWGKLPSCNTSSEKS